MTTEKFQQAKELSDKIEAISEMQRDSRQLVHINYANVRDGIGGLAIWIENEMDKHLLAILEVKKAELTNEFESL